VIEACEVSFDETMPCTTPAFEISGDDEEVTPIFEDEDDMDGAGDAGASAPTVAPAPSATSSEDEGGPLPTASSSLPRLQARADGGPAEDVGEVTSEQDHPPHRMIGEHYKKISQLPHNLLQHHHFCCIRGMLLPRFLKCVAIHLFYCHQLTCVAILL